MNNFTFDMAVKSENLYSNYVLGLYKQKLTLKFMEIKSNEPKLTQNQISNHLGFSVSTIKWYRDNNQMDRSYIGKKYRKKKIKSISTISGTQTPSTNKITNNNQNTKK